MCANEEFAAICAAAFVVFVVDQRVVLGRQFLSPALMASFDHLVISRSFSGCCSSAWPSIAEVSTLPAYLLSMLP